MKSIYLFIRLFCLIIIFSFQTGYLYAKSAVIITIDGLRPDAITAKNSPNLFKLIKSSSYTLKARTVYPSITIPSHVSLLTGLDVKNHNIRFNKWDSDQPRFNKPTIFTMMDSSNLSYSFICGKKKLLFLLSDIKDNTVICYDVDEDKKDIEMKIARDFINDFKTRKPPLSFVHFPQPDRSGHSFGWMSGEYIRSLHTVDNQIGIIIENLGKMKDLLIIVTADHGGHAKTHGTHADVDMTIPWIAYGDKIKKDHKIQKQVIIYDTAPTVLEFLNLKIPDGLDGSPVDEIFN